MACLFCGKVVTVRIGGVATDPDGCLTPEDATACSMLHDVYVEGEGAQFADLPGAKQRCYIDMRLYAATMAGPRVCSFCGKSGVACGSVSVAALCPHIPPHVAALEAQQREKLLAVQSKGE